MKILEVLESKGFEVESNRVQGIEISARKYFEDDPERLEQIKENDYCIVNIDFEDETAEYAWCSKDGNEANYPFENDNFEGVKQLLEELYI